jgi:hypothetical protein
VTGQAVRGQGFPRCDELQTSTFGEMLATSAEVSALKGHRESERTAKDCMASLWCANRQCEFAPPPGSATVLNARHPGRRGFAQRQGGSCGRGSVGRASPCQGEGRGFESRRPLGGVGRRIAVPMASTAPGNPVWFLGSGRGGVAEWPRQGPAKPCTRVRFPPPPRGRLAQWESATLTR